MICGLSFLYVFPHLSNDITPSQWGEWSGFGGLPMVVNDLQKANAV